MLNVFLIAVFKVVDLFLTIYTWIIIARCIISWVHPYPFHPVVEFLYRVTEPVLAPVRRVIPPIAGLDLSPIVVIFAIYFLQTFIHYTMVKYFPLLGF